MDETAKNTKSIKSAAPEDTTETAAGASVPPHVKRVRWDDSKMSTTFANVVNVLNTLEEFMLLFGTNQTWNAQESEELLVALNSRVVLTPHAAKRLFLLLQNRVQDYERRFGKLDI